MVLVSRMQLPLKALAVIGGRRQLNPGHPSHLKSVDSPY